MDVISYAAAKKAAKRLDAALIRLSAARPRDAYDSIMPDPPITAWTAPGGTSPINGGSPRIVPWTSPKISILGASLTKYASAQAGINDNSNGFIPGQYAVEIDHYGSDLALRVIQPSTNGGACWAWVDGRPVTAQGEQLVAAGSNSFAFYQLTFPDARRRRIRIFLHYLHFGGIDISPTDLLSAVRRPPVKIAFLGDSWVEGIPGPPTGTEGWTLACARMLGVNWSMHGQGGTGYVKTGASGRTAYTDPNRLAPLIAAAPDLVVVSGSSNDANQAGVSAAAVALFAALAAFPVFVVGPPRQPNSVNNASHLANRDDIRAAAAAAGNVIGMFDPHDSRDRSLTAAAPAAWSTSGVYNAGDVVTFTDSQGAVTYEAIVANGPSGSFSVSNFKPTAWVFGTGREGATTGDGPTDVIWRNDASHLTPLGEEMFGGVIADAICRAINTRAHA